MRCNQENLFRRILMNNLDLMLKRNKESAAPVPSLPESLQTLKAVIIGCADMRVDPAHVLGIKPGEAVVMRNIGGESRRACWRSSVCSVESERLQKRFREAAGSFT
jgi:carbonic anhydrase